MTKPTDALLRWKAIAALATTFTLVAGVAIFLASAPPAISLAAIRPASPALRLPEPGLERHGPPGQIHTVVLRAAPHLAADADPTALVDRLHRHGVRRVWLQCKQDETDEFTGGEVFYPSHIAPVARGFEDGRLWRLVDALRARQIAVAAWLPAFHDPHAVAQHPEWAAHQVDEAGTVVPQKDWVCPGHESAVAYEASLLAEVTRLGHGRWAAVYTDFIRYDDDHSCACARCLATLGARHGRPVQPAELRTAATADPALWQRWVRLRSDTIHRALDTMRDAIEEASPDIWFGACVLPFSAQEYALNTQSGQDYRSMCRAGIDELVVMGYWDDWSMSPQWLAESLECARTQVGGEARLTVLLDGDMSVRTTLATLASLPALEEPPAWFLYQAWDDARFTTLHRARRLADRHHTLPPAPFTAVTIRIDTEPDARGRYDTVHPEMIERLLDLFADEQVRATFITCGKLAELQQPVLARAEALGHEIGSHAYDHEQIDALPEEEQIAVVDRAIDVMRRRGFTLEGFGAPRNSMTEAARQRLIGHGLLYDGSAAYDPLRSYVGPELVRDEVDATRGLVVIPFIVPNDWDARFLAQLSPGEMAQSWIERLEKVAGSGEPCFVLDIHQWIAAVPENLEAVRTFIRAAKARGDCRVQPLRETARHTIQEILRLESESTSPITAEVAR